MILEDLFHQMDTSVRGYVGQADDTAVWELIEKDESPEIFVHRHQNAAFVPGPQQQHSVTGVRTAFPGLQYVMASSPQPFGQAMAGTAVYEKPHRAATVTSSSVSCAMTACA